MNRINNLCFALVTLLFFCGFSNTAQANLRLPECPVLEEWVKEIPFSNVGKSGRKAKIENLFVDEKIIPVFGISFHEWSLIEADLVSGLLANCAKKADERGDNRSNSRLEQVYRTLEKTQKMRRTGFKEPGCIFVYQWVARGTRLPSNITDKVSMETRYNILFADSYIIPLFGMPYDKWRNDDRQKAREILSSCRMRMSEKSDKDIVSGIDMAIRYMSLKR